MKKKNVVIGMAVCVVLLWGSGLQASIIAPDAATENNSGDWATYRAESAVVDDSVDYQVGSYSIRFDAALTYGWDDFYTTSGLLVVAEPGNTTLITSISYWSRFFGGASGGGDQWKMYLTDGTGLVGPIGMVAQVGKHYAYNTWGYEEIDISSLGLTREYDIGVYMRAGSIEGDESIWIDGLTIVPEPGTCALLIAGGATMLVKKRRCRKV